MNGRSILAIARKDALDIFLNKSTLFALIMPILMALLFTVLGKVMGSSTTELLVYNPSHTQVERVFVDPFLNPHITYARGMEEVENAFGPDGARKQTQYSAGLVVPIDYEQGVRSGQKPEIRLYFNGDKSNEEVHLLIAKSIIGYSRNLLRPASLASVSLAVLNPATAQSNNDDIQKYYLASALLISFLFSMSIVPTLIIEEKEKKTLRMLLVGPVSWGDIIMSKMLVGGVYHLMLCLVIYLLMGGGAVQLPELIFFIGLSIVFTMALGVLIGVIARNSSVAGTIGGIISFTFILPVFSTGVYAQIVSGNVFITFMKILPTYYIADAFNKSMQGQLSGGDIVLDVAILSFAAVACFVIAIWQLRQQAVVAGSI